jgi:hypothetical protein
MILPEGEKGKMTRMRVLHRRVELTGLAGKIDRSAEALRNPPSLS